MCGIAGIWRFNNPSANDLTKVKEAVFALNKRGPDYCNSLQVDALTLGHARLSIIDTSSAANQPLYSACKKGVIAFNGEIFNYKELADKYKITNKLNTHSDTEVLLELLLIVDINTLLNELNGFFSFIFYNRNKKQLIVARDRYGIKPLHYFLDNERIIFSSELKALLKLDVKKEIDIHSLNIYLHLNYIPAPNTIFKNIKKLLPGHYIEITDNSFPIFKKFYTLEQVKKDNTSISYTDAKNQLRTLLTSSVEKRLLADVPLGTFLSGGIDSSIITALAAQRVNELNTFSIGFADEPFFDETEYAQAVADKYKTNHHVFKLTNNDLFEHLFEMLDYLDEPFADSSALNVFILCKHTKQKVTVALSGDGADELFAGYNKHAAELFCREKKYLKLPAKFVNPLLNALPQSRNSYVGNKARQLNKLSEVASLSNEERYWRMAGYTSNKDKSLLLKKHQVIIDYFNVFKNKLSNDFNSVLLADQQLVLEGDMFVKADRMSMANSLEVREPFLDYRLVDFVNSLPAQYKIDNKQRKKILIDAFADLLPAEILNRSKKGFEVPLLKWFNNELKDSLVNKYLNKTFIEQQELFNYTEIQNLLNQVFSKSPGDSAARVWALLVFQHWYQKYYLDTM